MMSRTDRRPEDDPRYQRVRARLVGALLDLAATKPAEAIAVSELTSAAGVSRTTFYKHADSPAQLLASHLIDQIAPVMEPMTTLLETAEQDYLLRWRDITVDVLENVRSNRQIYGHVFGGEGESVVLAILTRYFERIYGGYVEDFAEHVVDETPTDLWKAMATSQQVHNLIAVISSWLRTGMVDSPEGVVSTYMSLAPPWQLAKFSPSGHTSLRRNRVVASLLESISNNDDDERSASSRSSSGSIHE